MKFNLSLPDEPMNYYFPNAREAALQMFQNELDRRCKTFKFEDGATWPVEDGLYIGLAREPGRTCAIVLQWASDVPATSWRGVQRYLALKDILPSDWTPHTRHTTQREG